MSAAAAFAANEAIRNGEFDDFLPELLRSIQKRAALIDPDKPPTTWLPKGQVWVWMNYTDKTPQWEPRGTGVVFP